MTATNYRRFEATKPQGRGLTLSILHPAHRSGRSMFPSRVFDPDEVARVLKSGKESRKIGKFVLKGRLRGAPILALTLEERATCPRSCAMWSGCYGNRMQAAERLTPGKALEAALWKELAAMQEAHPRGFLVRLHVLGDFYSTGYVDFWKAALGMFPALHVFGYTARDPNDDPIGRSLSRLASRHWNRFAVRFSGNDGPKRGSIVVDRAEGAAALICPAQLGKTDSCGSCALCWHSDRTIAFLRH